MPRPVWFEIPADDVKRAVEFYHSVFGWEMKEAEGWPDYYMVGWPPTAASVIGGAIMSRKGHACTRNTVDVPSLDDALAKVAQAGGKMIGEKMPIPSGSFAVCVDTEGNEFGLMEPLHGEIPDAAGQPEAMLRVVHFDLPAEDPERAAKFYHEVFGWEIMKWDGPMEYWLVSTGKAPAPGMNGGIARRQDGMCVTDTVQVPDADEYTSRAKAAGATIIMEKSQIPGVGWFVMIEDTEGNRLGMMEPAGAR